MKRRLKIKKVRGKFRVPVNAEYAGLKALFREAGFLDAENKETKKGQRALS